MKGKMKSNTHSNPKKADNSSSKPKQNITGGSSNTKKKNKFKKTKDTIKNTLANPFSLDWPSLNFKDYTDIKCFLKNSLSSISKDYEMYQKEKNIKRKEFYAMKLSRKGSDSICKSENMQISEKDPTNEKVNPIGLVIGNESLVFGYNAVMRGLEKGSVISLLVNSKAKPDLIVKMFIPICSIKSIPVIPVDDLPDIVKDAGIGIKSCLVLGLKKSVTLEGNLFHKLYMKTCEALGFDALSSDKLVENNQFIEEPPKISPKHTENDEKTLKLSAEQISCLHLRRSNINERIFKPNQIADNSAASRSNILNLNPDFIRLDKISERKVSEKEDKKNVRKKRPLSLERKEFKKNVRQNRQLSAASVPHLDASKFSSTSMFMIDSKGDLPDRNEINDSQSETRDEILPNLITNNFSDNTANVKKETSAACNQTHNEVDNVVQDQCKANSVTLSTVSAVDDFNEVFNSSLPVSGEINKSIIIKCNTDSLSNAAANTLDEVNNDSSKVLSSASSRPLMNKKKRKFEGFCYVPTKIKRIKSNIKRAGK